MHENADMVAPLTTADNFSLAPVVLFTQNQLQRSSVISLLSEAEIPLQKVVAHLHKLIYSQVEVFKKKQNNKALSDLSCRGPTNRHHSHGLHSTVINLCLYHKRG